MDAKPIITEVARVLRETSLDAVLIGGAAAALHGVIRDEDSLQLDFMTQIHGISSFNSLRSRAVEIDLGTGESLMVASLPDIILSKRTADRPRDRASLETLEQTLRQTENKTR